MGHAENRIETSVIQLPSKVTQPPVVFGKKDKLLLDFFFISISILVISLILLGTKKIQCLLGNSTLYKVKGIRKKSLNYFFFDFYFTLTFF